MLLVRLIRCDRNGFMCDLMHAPEYEWSVVRNGRVALAESFLKGQIAARLTAFIEVDHGVKCPSIDTVFMGRKDFITTLAPTTTIHTTAAAFNTYNKDIVAWMKVGPPLVDPLFIVRVSLELAQERIDAYVKPYLEGLRAEKALKEKQDRLLAMDIRGDKGNG